MLPVIQLEVMFPDGNKLVSVQEPIRLEKTRRRSSGIRTCIDGLLRRADHEISCRRDSYSQMILSSSMRAGMTIELVVNNTGDRSIQVCSHYHFLKRTSALRFDREKAFGYQS